MTLSPLRSSIALVAMSLLLAPTAALALAGGPTLSLQPNTSTISTNNQFTVQIILDTKTYTATAADVKVTFPSDKLQALSIAAGTFLSTELVPGSVGAGTATITMASGTSGKQGTGTVATITFKALSAGSAAITFDTSTQIAAIGQTTNVVDTMSSTTVTISGASVVTPTPTATPTTTPTPAAGVCSTQYDPVCGVNGVTYMNRCSAEIIYRKTVAYVGACTTASLTPTPSPRIPSVGQISTGPGDVTVVALILSSLTTLLYVGYTRSNAFRKNEIEKIAEDERQTPPDFRS